MKACRCVWPALATMIAVIVVTCAGFVGPAAQSRADDVLPGSDLFVTVPGAGPTIGTTYDFSTSALPAGFFGPGSDPFTGRVDFRGSPFGLGSTDTIVQRSSTAHLPTVPSSDTIPIEIVALSLVSVQPITVTYQSNPAQQWNVSLVQAPSPSNGGGTGLQQVNPNGGFMIGSFFDIFTEISFDRFNLPSVPGLPGQVNTNRLEHVVMATAPWSHRQPSGTYSSTNNFFPGGDPFNLSASAVPLRFTTPGGGGFSLEMELTPVPEPGAITLALSGALVGLGWLWRRRRHRRPADSSVVSAAGN